MEPRSTEGIVLRRREFTESSFLVDFITPDWGCLKTIAKGARRPESRFRGRLELFNRGRLIFYPSRRTDLHLLGQFDPFQVCAAPGATLERAAYFYYLAELILASGYGAETGKGLFALLKRELERAPAIGRVASQQIRFEIDFLQVLGVFPPLQTCGRCQGPTSPRLYFSPSSRIWICPSCRRSESGAVFIQEGVRAMINHILEGEQRAASVIMSSAQEKILGRLCRHLVDINLDKKIKSLAFLQQVIA